MSQNLRVSRNIEFLGDAAQEANIVGNMLEKKIHYSYRPGIATDTFALVAAVPGTADTVAVSEVQGGSWLFTTGTTDGDTCFLATAIIFSGTKKAVAEARVKIVDVDLTGLYVGFCSAKSTANVLPISYLADALTTTAVDGCGFVCDPASTTHGASHILCCGVAANVDATTVDSEITWADNEAKTLRVELDGTSALFYVDGKQVGKVLLAVTAATLQCFLVAAASRSAAAKTVYVSRMDVWQDE